MLGIGAISYVVVAWQVTPGFYDCCAVAPQYNWVSPPPFATSNKPPESGHDDIAVANGLNEPSAAATGDGQLVMGFLPGVFDPGAKSTITVDIKPVATFPDPHGLRFVTNVYLVTSNASLVKDAGIVMMYSDLLPDPSAMYVSTGDGSPWESIGASSQAQPWTINTKTRELGYFAAGYPSSATNGDGRNSQILPIAVAVLIVGVLVAGFPLAIVRRRRASGGEDVDAE